jgi:diadenosine tetraphosphate (Ap4A) HIT family hydrolase
MKEETSCKICDIHKTELSGLVLVTKDWVIREAEAEKNCKGYLYIEPIIHVEKFTDFNYSMYASLGTCIEEGMKWIYKHNSPQKIYTVTISEAVPHIHFHLVPRYIDFPKGLDYLKLALEGKL